MPGPSETLPVLEQHLTERLLAFERLGQRHTRVVSRGRCWHASAPMCFTCLWCRRKPGWYITPASLRVRLLENHFGDEIRNFRIEPAALTGLEATYLAGFRDADQLRATVAKAKGERERRLLQKGIRPQAEDDRLSLSATVNPRFACPVTASTPEPEGEARCVSSARRDLRGGNGQTRFPTATLPRPFNPADPPCAAPR